jgi:hypothetical protein
MLVEIADEQEATDGTGLVVVTEHHGEPARKNFCYKNPLHQYRSGVGVIREYLHAPFIRAPLNDAVVIGVIE